MRATDWLWAACAAAVMVGGAAQANERRFTYTYESAVLPPGEREIEVWLTPRLGRDGYFAQIDQRLEFEVGLTERLMMALYLNQSQVTLRVGEELQTGFSSRGFSTEFKYKLLDPVADPVGFALYAEGTASTDELELEAKLIFDKKFGKLLLGANLVLEHEWEFRRPGEVDRELLFIVTLAGTYFLTDRLSLGLELFNHNEFPAGEGWEHSALYAGPVVAYSERTWWMALTLAPQLPALKGHGHAGPDLHEHERFNARLLFAFQL